MSLLQIQPFSINASATFTFANVVVTSNISSGNANLGNLVTANYHAGVLTTGAQPNITSVGTLSGLTSGGTINLTTASNVSLGAVGNVHITGGSSGQYLQTDGTGNLSWVTVVNSSLSNGTSNVVVLNNGNVDISAAGNANVLVVTGTGVNVTGTLNSTGNLTSANANLGNLATANYFTGTLTTNAQPNITSLGTLSSLVVTGDTTVTGNLTVTGNTTFINSNISLIEDPVITLGGGANGAALTTNDSKDRGTLLHYYTTQATDAFMGWKNSTGEFVFASNANLSSSTGVVTVNTLGNIKAGNANLGNLVTSNYFAGVLTTAAQPNITSVGTLTSLVVTANITSGNANLGNLVTSNYFTGVLTTNAQPNITSTGTLAGLTATGVINLTGASNVALGSNANVHITGGSSGQYLQTDGTGNLSWVSVSSGSLSNGTSNIQILNNGNIDLSVAGNANVVVVTGTGVNVAGTLNATGNANVGNIGAAAGVFTTVAGNLTTAAQPNITSVGTLSSLSVGGTLSLNAIGNLYIPGGSSGYVIKTDGQGNLSFAAAGATGNANIAGSNTQIFFNNNNSNTLGASANLTFNNSTNTLTTTNLVVNGTTNLGAIGNVTITGGSSNQYMRTDGSGTLTWVSLPSTTVNVDTFTGDGTTTAFTLTATPTSVNYTIVAVGGVVQPRSAYTVSSTTITFSSAPYNTALVEVTTIVSGVSVASGGGGGGSYTYSGISANTTLAKGTRYIVNTSSANLTLTLPTSASSTLGDEIGVIDGTGTAATHAMTLTVSGGGNIMGGSGDMVVNTNRAAFTLVYYNSTQGWILTNV